MATKEEKESMNRLKACLKSILLPSSPPTVLNTIDTPISTHSEYKENNSSQAKKCFDSLISLLAMHIL